MSGGGVNARGVTVQSVYLSAYSVLTIHYLPGGPATMESIQQACLMESTQFFICKHSLLNFLSKESLDLY